MAENPLFLIEFISTTARRSLQRKALSSLDRSDNLRLQPHHMLLHLA